MRKRQEGDAAVGVRAEVDTVLHLTESFLSKRAKQLSLPLTTSLSLPLSISTTPAIHNYCIGTAVEVGLSNVRALNCSLKIDRTPPRPLDLSFLHRKPAAKSIRGRLREHNAYDPNARHVQLPMTFSTTTR